MAETEPVTQAEAGRRFERLLGASRVWIISLRSGDSIIRTLQLPKDALAVAPLQGKPIRCVDLRQVSEHAKTQGALCAVDLTLCGIRACAANRLGADVSYARLYDDLYLVGISSGLAKESFDLVHRLDGLEDSHKSIGQYIWDWLDKTDARWRKTSDAAQVVASYLRCHPKVGYVCYPGLRTDPSYKIASHNLMCGFGPYVDYSLAEGSDWCRITCTMEDVHQQINRLEQALA